MFDYYEHLGFHSPYFFVDKDASFCIKENFHSIHAAFKEKSQLDITAVIQVLNRKYMLGDRTLIKDIHKTPWMAKPDFYKRNWLFANVPNHDEKRLSIEDIAETLFELIQKEILEYIGQSKRIGVLLSGGMDSRIVAGALDYLIRRNEMRGIQVTALTWGMEGSRDVIYAKQIAKSLGWNWKHYSVGAQDLIKNIEVAALHGSEYSPVHLHAMPQIKEEKNIDCILAGSFGDSIGRGEYSGRKVANLRSIAGGFKNVGYFMRSNSYNNNKNLLTNDVEFYHEQFPQENAYQQFEQDYQIHYMRRMLNSCMSIINENIPLYQVFTKPEVFGFMWSLSPEIRGDSIYEYLLRFLKSDLREIPWSRTGLIYGATGKEDNYSKKHHKYYEIINDDLLGEIKNIIFNSNIFELGIFNKNAIKTIFKAISTGPKKDNDFFGERVIWLASLSRTIDIYRITNEQKINSSVSDFVNGFLGTPLDYLQKTTKKKIINHLK